MTAEMASVFGEAPIYLQFLGVGAALVLWWFGFALLGARRFLIGGTAIGAGALSWFLAGAFAMGWRL